MLMNPMVPSVKYHLKQIQVNDQVPVKKKSPTSCKWSYNPVKWPYKWVIRVISPF